MSNLRAITSGFPFSSILGTAKISTPEITESTVRTWDSAFLQATGQDPGLIPSAKFPAGKEPDASGSTQAETPASTSPPAAQVLQDKMAAQASLIAVSPGNDTGLTTVNVPKTLQDSIPQTPFSLQEPVIKGAGEGILFHPVSSEGSQLQITSDISTQKAAETGKTTETQKVTGRPDLIKFDALETLEFTYKDQKTGKEITSWAIYAEPDDPANLQGNFHQVEAPGEGYGCVDDVARVGLVYLQDYEKTHDPASLDKAKKAMEFCISLADGEGEFYNFVDKHGKINTGGGTSKADMDWWTARAAYLLGKGINVIGDKDPDLTKRAKETFDITLNKLVWMRENPQIAPEVKPMYEKTGIEPGTLVGDSGTVSSIFVLGLLERYKADKDPKAERLIKDYCNAMVKLEEKSDCRYPMTNFHVNTLWDEDLVDIYGNRQVKALAEAGKALGEKKWIESAEREADKAYPRLMSSWGAAFGLSPDPEIYPQISYTVETVVSNLMAVHEATGKEKYAALAGMMGSWYMGNNPAGKPVYNPEKGRTFDGVDQNGINKNSGAESNIETLLALENMAGSKAYDFLNFKPAGTADRQPLLVHAETFDSTSGSIAKEKRTFSGGAVKDIYVASPSGAVKDTVEVAKGGRYRAYLNYRSKGPGEKGTLQATLQGKPHTIPLTHSSADYHYRPVNIGVVDVHGDNKIAFSLENKQPDQEVRLSSVILQPDLQTKTWSDGNRTVTMAVNTSPESIILPPDLQATPDSGAKLLYTGENVKQGMLPPGGWVMIEKK